MQICVVYTYPCCNEFACRALCAGSGKWEASIYYEAAWGTNNKKRDDELMDNGHQIPGITGRSWAMRGILVRVRLAPFVLLRSCGGHIDMLFAVMSTLFRCNATHCCTPFPDIMKMHAYAHQQMHTCLLRLVHLYRALVDCSLYHTMNHSYFCISAPTRTPLPSISSSVVCII